MKIDKLSRIASLPARVYSQLGFAVLLVMVHMASYANLFDGRVNTSTDKKLSDLATAWKGEAESLGPPLLSGVQLLGLGLAGVGAFKMYRHFKNEQLAEQGYLKAGIAGIALGSVGYFSPRFLGMAGKTIFPS